MELSVIAKIAIMLVVAMGVMACGYYVIRCFFFSSDAEFKTWFSRTVPATALTLIVSDILHLDYSNARDCFALLSDLAQKSGLDFILFVVLCLLSKLLVSLSPEK